MSFSSDFVVLRQIPDGQWADMFEVLYVDVTGESAEDAIRKAATDENKGGAGRYIAIPNSWWIAQNVTVKKIAEVNMETQELI
jgi:hypothetical protein